MDKVKLALTQLKKHHFWVLCGLIVVTALLSWAQATGDLAGQTEKRIKALEGEFATVQNVNLQPNHPNETVIKAIREAIDGASDKPGVKHNVLRAWTILYDEQKNKNALPDVLGKRFKEHFENLPPNGELDPDDLDTYMYQIEKYFPKLFRMIDLRRRKDTSLDVVLNQPTPKDQHNTGEKAERVDMVGTVEWDRANLDPLLKRFHWIGRPETKDVRLAQEDLWVYESLLRIIKDTNEGTTYDTAAIRKIEALEIGREAVESWRKAEDTVFHSGASSLGTGSPAGTAFSGHSGMSPLAGTGYQKPSPLADRYVDDKGKPLSDETKQPYAEFKMMPINLRLVIHQKKITRLLAHCANSNMPIQVRTVRLRPGEGEVLNLGAISGATASVPFGGSGAGGGAATTHSAHHGVAHNQEHHAAGEEATDSNYIPIEVQGITYIYNPPNMSQVGTGLAAGAPAAATAAPPAFPTPLPALTPPKLPPIGGPAAGTAATTAPPAPARGVKP